MIEEERSTAMDKLTKREDIH